MACLSCISPKRPENEQLPKLAKSQDYKNMIFEILIADLVYFYSFSMNLESLNFF
jgi:hypothetical protein